MLNWIPLRGTWRVVADRDGNAVSVADILLETSHPNGATRTVSATAIGEDEKVLRVRVTNPPLHPPPGRETVDGKLGRPFKPAVFIFLQFLMSANTIPRSESWPARCESHAVRVGGKPPRSPPARPRLPSRMSGDRYLLPRRSPSKSDASEQEKHRLR